MFVLRFVLTPLLFAALVYVACMGAWLRYGKPWLVDLYRGLLVLFAGLAVYLLVAPFLRGDYVSVFVHNLAFWVPSCVLCAFSAYSAYDYAKRRKDYVVVGDPVEHWSRRLLGGRFWWTRLRAARELSFVEDRDEEIARVVEQAWRVERNTRVRDALTPIREREPPPEPEPEPEPPPEPPVVPDDEPLELR